MDLDSATKYMRLLRSGDTAKAARMRKRAKKHEPCGFRMSAGTGTAPQAVVQLLRLSQQKARNGLQNLQAGC